MHSLLNVDIVDPSSLNHSCLQNPLLTRSLTIVYPTPYLSIHRPNSKKSDQTHNKMIPLVIFCALSLLAAILLHFFVFNRKRVAVVDALFVYPVKSCRCVVIEAEKRPGAVIRRESSGAA